MPGTNNTMMRKVALFLVGTSILRLDIAEARVWSHPPSMVASDMPSLAPSGEPSDRPTPAPSVSVEPSLSPSLSPSQVPTSTPTIPPTSSPSSKPSGIPTVIPSASPTELPTTTPSVLPTNLPTASPSGVPSDFPSLVPTGQPSATPSITPTASPSVSPSLIPTTSPTTAPSNAPSVSPSLQPTSTPSLVPTSTPSLTPSEWPTSTPTALPSSAPSNWPSDWPSMVPTSRPSSVPSMSPTSSPSAAPTGVPSDFPSLVPTDRPSSTPSSTPTSKPSVVPSLSPSSSPTNRPSFSPSSIPTAIPSKSPSNSPSNTPTSAPTSLPSSSPSKSPSLAPSVSPSTTPTSSPSVAPSNTPTVPPTGFPSAKPSVSPSSMPTARPSGMPTTVPSSSPTQIPTGVPSSIPTALGEVTTIESVTLESTQNKIMDAETTAVFERVCQFDFLAFYLPRMFPANYTDIQCNVISQTLLTGDDGRRRNLQDKSVVQLSTGNTAILFRVRSKMELQNGATLTEETTFDVILEKTFKRYGESFQDLLCGETGYFECPSISGNRAAGLEGVVATESSSGRMPTVIILGSALGGAIMAIGLATYLLRRSNNAKGPATPPQDTTDDSVLLLFEVANKKDKPENEENSSINPYLPPTPLGIGVPSEIGPDSWIEPDDELSASSPDNQAVEASAYVGTKDPFGFDRDAPRVLRDIQKSNSDPDSRALVPRSRAAQILASLASESSSRISSDQNNSHLPASRSYPLETVESRESEDDDTKPTVSSKGSQPTKGSNYTGHGSQSDGSSTLHGLKLVGTMSGYQSNEGSNSAPQVPDYDSDPSHEKKTFFRKVMKRKSAPTLPTVKGPPIEKAPKRKSAPSPPTVKGPSPSNTPPKKVNTTYEFSSHPNRRGLVLPTTGGADKKLSATRDDSSSLPTTATAPTKVITNKTASSRDDTSSIPTTLTTDSLLFSRTASSMTAQYQESSTSQLKKQPGTSGVYKTASSNRSPKSHSSKHGKNAKRQRSQSNYGKHHDNQKSVHSPKRVANGRTRSSASLQESSTMETGPAPHSPESFVRKSETPSGKSFLQMSTDSAQHTGNVLEDLGRLEDEWDGQLESKLSATATTPRHTNSEKFRKPPRPKNYQDRNMV